MSSSKAKRTPAKAKSVRAKTKESPLTTPDGRYLIVNGRLWRTTNRNLSANDKDAFVKALMSARRAVAVALKSDDEKAERSARRRVHKAKLALGERGPVWWNDGEPDYNRRLVKNTPYATWFARRR